MRSCGGSWPGDVGLAALPHLAPAPHSPTPLPAFPTPTRLRPPRVTGRAGRVAQVTTFAAVALGGALVGQFLGPDVRLDFKTVAMFVGILVSIALDKVLDLGVGLAGTQVTLRIRSELR